MRGAARLACLQVTVGGVCLAVVAIGTAVALSSVTLAASPSHAVAAACKELLPSAHSVAALATLLLPLLAAAVIVLGARSLFRQLRATRRHLRSLPPTGELVRVGTARCAVVHAAEPLAFCAGYLRPRIYISALALKILSRPEIEAVVAHERHHQRRRDPLRLLALRTLADSLAFLPALRAMSRRHASLLELAADDAAVRATGSRAPLASALLRFAAPSPAPGVAVAGIAAARVDHLRGDPEATRWNLPGGILGTSAVAISLILAAVATLGVSGPPSGSLVILAAESCMPAMLLPAGVAGIAGMSRILRRSSRD